MGDPFVCPFTRDHGHVITPHEKWFNDYQRAARVIIENVFGHAKNRFPIIAEKYKLSLRTIGGTVRNAFLLNNIIVIYQSPMRQ